MGKKARIRREKAAQSTRVPTYNFTEADLSGHVNRAIQARIDAHELMRYDDALRLRKDIILDLIELGRLQVYTAIMEKHLMSWNRIEKTLLPKVDETTTEIYEGTKGTGFDLDEYIGIVGYRFEEIKSRTRNYKKEASDG